MANAGMQRWRGQHHLSLIDCGGNGFDFLDCAVFWYMAGGLGHSGATFGALVLNVLCFAVGFIESIFKTRKNHGEDIATNLKVRVERSSEIENKNL